MYPEFERASTNFKVNCGRWVVWERNKIVPISKLTSYIFPSAIYLSRELPITISPSNWLYKEASMKLGRNKPSI